MGCDYERWKVVDSADIAHFGSLLKYTLRWFRSTTLCMQTALCARQSSAAAKAHHTAIGDGLSGYSHGVWARFSKSRPGENSAAARTPAARRTRASCIDFYTLRHLLQQIKRVAALEAKERDPT